MIKTKKAGRPSVWPKGSMKPLSLGPMPTKIHAEIKAFARAKKAEVLSELNKKEVPNG